MSPVVYFYISLVCLFTVSISVQTIFELGRKALGITLLVMSGMSFIISAILLILTSSN